MLKKWPLKGPSFCLRGTSIIELINKLQRYQIVNLSEKTKINL